MEQLTELLEQARLSAQAARRKAMQARSNAVENEWTYVAAMWEARAQNYEEALGARQADASGSS